MKLGGSTEPFPSIIRTRAHSSGTKPVSVPNRSGTSTLPSRSKRVSEGSTNSVEQIV